MPFNATWPTYTLVNTTSFHGLLTYGNSVTEGAFVPLIMVGIFMVMLVTMNKRGFEEAFAASSLITAILSLFMWAMGVVPDWFVVLFIFATAGSGVMLKKKA